MGEAAITPLTCKFTLFSFGQTLSVILVYMPKVTNKWVPQILFYSFFNFYFYWDILLSVTFLYCEPTDLITIRRHDTALPSKTAEFPYQTQRNILWSYSDIDHVHTVFYWPFISILAVLLRNLRALWTYC